LENQSLTVIYVTYKREAEIKKSISYLTPFLDQVNEIIVVDNGKSPSLKRDLAQEYGKKVTVIQPEENLGAVARTLGIMASTGDIVVTLDDDIHLKSPDQLTSLQHIFSSNLVACVNFKILYEGSSELDISDWCHPRPADVFFNSCFDTTYISEGACAFKGDVIRELDAYSLDLFIGQEGVELAAKILNKGYSILYTPNIIAHHSVAEAGRTSGRQFYYNTRNIIIVALKYYPVAYAMRVILRELTTLIVFSAIKFKLNYFFKGFFSGVAYIRSDKFTRSTISHVAVEKIKYINRCKPGFITLFKKVYKSKTLT